MPGIIKINVTIKIKEVNAREKRMLQIRDKLMVAILIYVNTRKEKRDLNWKISIFVKSCF